ATGAAWLCSVRIWRSRSEASWLETPRRARSASRVIGRPCLVWCSAATRRAKSSSGPAGPDDADEDRDDEGDACGEAGASAGTGMEVWPPRSSSPSSCCRSVVEDAAAGAVERCSHTTHGDEDDGTDDEDDEPDGDEWPKESGTGSTSAAGRDAGRVAAGVVVLRRSSMETATRKQAAGVPAVIQPHTDGSACARFAARDSRMPPTRTTVGHDSRPVGRPVFLSRWRSAAAMTQV